MSIYRPREDKENVIVEDVSDIQISKIPISPEEFRIAVIVKNVSISIN